MSGSCGEIMGGAVLILIDENEGLKRRSREILTLDDFTAEDVAALETARAPEAARAFDSELMT